MAERFIQGLYMWRQGTGDMSDISGVIHFFESEIEMSKQRMDSEESCCFNGVCVGGGGCA